MKNESQILAIRDLRVRYNSERGPVTAVDGVSFSIMQGEVFGLAGESGCGKSTIAQTILRVLRPPAVITGGSIEFRDRQVLEMTDEELASFRWREVSLVFQSAMNSLNPLITIGDQILDVIQAHTDRNKRDARERAAEMLKRVGIEPDRLRSYPHELSGGMRQRAVIAMALSLEPTLAIMDEPTTALDVLVQRQILEEIEELRTSIGFSILFITHDLSLLVGFSQRIAIMYAGQIVEMSYSSELVREPFHPYTLGLLDSFPSVNGERRKLIGIPGTPPDMSAPPGGCRFHPRCAKAMERCRFVAPQLRELKPDHWVACHLYD